MSSMKANRLRLIWFGAIVVLITIVIVFLPRFQSEKLTLPRKLGTLQLTEEIRGDRASRIINQMHGKGVTPADNMIGMYTSREGMATVYQSKYNSRKQSEETLRRMVRGIETGNTPFSDFKSMQIAGQDIFFCIGSGQAHYFFTADEFLYWLATDIHVAEDAAQELIRAIRGSSITT